MQGLLIIAGVVAIGLFLRNSLFSAPTVAPVAPYVPLTRINPAPLVNPAATPAPPIPPNAQPGGILSDASSIVKTAGAAVGVGTAAVGALGALGIGSGAAAAGSGAAAAATGAVVAAETAAAAAGGGGAAATAGTVAATASVGTIVAAGAAAVGVAALFTNNVLVMFQSLFGDITPPEPQRRAALNNLAQRLWNTVAVSQSMRPPPVVTNADDTEQVRSIHEWSSEASRVYTASFGDVGYLKAQALHDAIYPRVDTGSPARHEY